MRVLDVTGSPLGYLLAPGNIAVGNVASALIPSKDYPRALKNFLHHPGPTGELEAFLESLFP